VGAVAIDLDGALGDTRPLWADWLADVSRRARVELELPEDRGEAAAALDDALPNWRDLLERFAEDRAPVYLRPDAEASTALRRLHAAGTRVGVFTDAPEPLARVALAQLGALRRVNALETGAGALERLTAELGAGTQVVRSVGELVETATPAKPARPPGRRRKRAR
jgi:phosphoglycolate phosphatase-like HAD superfamily hydrolase